MIARYLENQMMETLRSDLYPAVMLYGARQVGKTTLIKHLADKIGVSSNFFACDDPMVGDLFEDINIERLKRIAGDYPLLIFDEAQKIHQIGLILKLIIDYIPGVKLLVSGSSSFELANRLSEPLTGRKKSFLMLPLAIKELYKANQVLEIKSNLSHYLRFGLYPKTHHISNETELQNYLIELSGDYLYKDILEFTQIRNNEQMRRLLTALALQVGQEVSFTELANLSGIDQKTVMRYIDLLEKSYIVFRLPAFSRNQRNEIMKSRKIYFYDLGIRNALIRNFNEMNYRDDRGRLWENFMIMERIKRDQSMQIYKNYYFWRTYEQQEIDLIEEHGGNLKGFEFKVKSGKAKASQFIKTYPGSSVEVVSQDNFEQFIF
jgi:uncharacterized protein